MTGFPSMPRIAARLPVPARAGASLLGFALATLSAMAASLSGLEQVAARSTSGQFVVRGLPQGTPSVQATNARSGYLRLDPTLTAISLERIKQVVQQELNMPPKWRGLISVQTFPSQDGDSPVRVTSVHYKDGWGYGVELPEVVDKPRFVKCAVGLILAEFANRNALVQEAEIPRWLTEGLAAHLEATSLQTLALEPGRFFQSEARVDPLRKARELVRERGALTFTQLSLPGEAELSDANHDLFRACSHIFVHELLRLRDGRDALREMLARLPSNLNWQTAFLQAFQGHFPRLTEADKWYMLAATHISERDALSLWPISTTFAQLDELLSTSVEVRTSADQLPIHTQVKLQRILAEWETAKQDAVLEQKLSRFEVLRRRGAAELLGIIADYEGVVDSCLHRRVANPRTHPRDPAPNPRLLIRDAIRRLDQLDRRLEVLRDKLLLYPEPSTSPRNVSTRRNADL